MTNMAEAIQIEFINDVSIELMEKQLKELIKHCEVEDVILYGVSFGAAVVAKYAANNPENVSFIGYQVPLIEFCKHSSIINSKSSFIW